jgi:hypothetical protein
MLLDNYLSKRFILNQVHYETEPEGLYWPPSPPHKNQIVTA